MDKFLFVFLISACSPWKISYGPPGITPLVHPDRDADRHYVVVETSTFGDRLFFFDTGYTTTTCDDDFIAELGLTPYGSTKIRGEAGSINAAFAKLPPFEIAGHVIENGRCIVRDLHMTSSIRDPSEVAIAGVLGMDLLREFQLRIDPAQAEVVWTEPTKTHWEKQPSIVKLRREWGIGRRVTLPIQVNGRKLRPVLDTGAANTWLPGRLVDAEFVRRQSVRIEATGSGGSRPHELITWSAESLEIAGIEFKSFKFFDRQVRGSDGLAGLDILSRFQQEYDFKHRQARFFPTDSIHIPSWREWRSQKTYESNSIK